MRGTFALSQSGGSETSFEPPKHRNFYRPKEGEIVQLHNAQPGGEHERYIVKAVDGDSITVRPFQAYASNGNKTGAFVVDVLCVRQVQERRAAA